MATVAKAFEDDKARLIASLKPAGKAPTAVAAKTSSPAAKPAGKSVVRKPPKRTPSRTSK